MNTKPLPKSLHTVTVLVRVARTLKPYCERLTWREALDDAFYVLGYNPNDDPHCLFDAALKQLDVS